MNKYRYEYIATSKHNEINRRQTSPEKMKEHVTSRAYNKINHGII